MEPCVSVPIANPTHPADTALELPARASARTLSRVPGVPRTGKPRLGAPKIPLGQRAERKLRHQYRTCSVEPLDHLGVVIEVLVHIWASTPRRWIALDREQVFSAPRNSMQRPTVLTRYDLPVSISGLLEGAVLGKRDDEVQQRIITLEPCEVHLRKRCRRHLAGSQKFAKLSNGKESERLTRGL